MFKVILGWIQQHIVATIVISVVVVGGAVATPIILLNGNDVLKSNEDTKTDVKQDQDQEPEEPQESELNEDGCPVGFFLNYYGICQDEHLYEPQECQDGYIWWANNLASYDHIEDAFGIDGLPKGICEKNYETQNAWYKSHGYPGMDPKDKELYNHLGDCERGFSWDSETNTCKDKVSWYRSYYEDDVLSKHDPKDDLPKCSERSESDQACLKD